MDIGYLLTLQDFRNLYGEYFTTFFQKMTYFGELSTTLLIIAGIYLLLTLVLTSLVKQLEKRFSVSD